MLADFMDTGKGSGEIKTLVCHNKEKCSVAKKMCDWMHNCSGHGHCQENGLCKCKRGFKTADCSLAQIELDPAGTSREFRIRGPKWFLFGYDYQRHFYDDVGLAIEVTGGLTYDLYLSAGVDNEVNEYKHDLSMKAVESQLILSSQAIPAMRRSVGFTVAVFVNGLDERKNKRLKGTLQVKFRTTTYVESHYFTH